jgi:hypothetical protein
MAMTVSLTSKGKGKTAAQKKTAAKPKPANRQRFGETWSGANSFDSHTFKAMPIIQPKLKVGDPNDKYEQEADRVADEVMRMPDREVVDVTSARPPTGNGTPAIQRMCSDCAKEEETLQRKPSQTTFQQPKISSFISAYSSPFLRSNPETRLQRQEMEEEEPLQMKQESGVSPTVTPSIEAGIQSLKGGGQPLSQSERAFFEPRFGHDFSNVRIHSDTNAINSAQALNAQAYSVGLNIVFGAGKYSPKTSPGKHLLAHELTHVLQQAENPVVRRQEDKNDVQTKAIEIYGQYQGDLPSLGEALYQIVAESTVNVSIAMYILDHIISRIDRDNLAYYFVKSSDEETLKKIAGDESGRNLVELLKKEMQSGVSTFSERDEIKKIDRTLSGADNTEALSTLEKPIDDDLLLVISSQFSFDPESGTLTSTASKIPSFPGDINPLEDLGAVITHSLYYDLLLAWNLIGIDQDRAQKRITEIQNKAKSFQPLIQCIEKASSSKGRTKGETAIEGLISELQYVIEQIENLSEETGSTYGRITYPVEQSVYYLLDLDDTFEYLEETGSVGSCIAVNLLPLSEGIMKKLDTLPPEEASKFSGKMTQNPLFGHGFMLGAQAGILLDAKDLIAEVLASVMEPMLASKALIESMQGFIDLINELASPAGADIAKEIGRSIGEQFIAKLQKLNRLEGQFTFAFELGKTVGPSIVYTILSLLGFEALVAGRLLLLAGEALKKMKSFSSLLKLFKAAPDGSNVVDGRVNNASGKTTSDRDKSPMSRTKASKLALGESVEVDLGEDIGVHTLTLVEKSGKLVVRLCSKECGELIEKLDAAFKAAGEGSPTQEYINLLNQARELDQYWDLYGPKEASLKLEILKKEFAIAAAKDPNMAKSVVNADSNSTNTQLIESDTSSSVFRNDASIAGNEFYDAEDAFRSLFPDNGRVLSADKDLDYGVHSLTNEKVRSAFLEIGEDPNDWVSIHYIVRFENGNEETISVFFNEDFGRYRGPH